MTGGFFLHSWFRWDLRGRTSERASQNKTPRRTSESGFKAKQRSRFVLDIRRYARDYFYRDANTHEAKILGDFIREKLIVTAERKVFYFHFTLGEQIKFKNFISSFRHDFKPSPAIACVSRADLNANCWTAGFKATQFQMNPPAAHSATRENFSPFFFTSHALRPTKVFSALQLLLPREQKLFCGCA